MLSERALPSCEQRCELCQTFNWLFTPGRSNEREFSVRGGILLLFVCENANFLILSEVNVNPFVSPSVLPGFYFIFFLTFFNDFARGRLSSSSDKHHCTFNKNSSLNTGTAG